MKKVLLLPFLLGLTIFTNGAPATDRHAEEAVKADSNCFTEFYECKEMESKIDCEKEFMECTFNNIGNEEILQVLKRTCGMPVFAEGAKKRYSALKKDVDCYEEFMKCENEHPEQEEKIPLNIITECMFDSMECVVREHIMSYSDLVEKGRENCKMFRESEAEVPEEPCEVVNKRCLEAAEGNLIAVAECDDVYENCKLEEAAQ